MKNILVLFVSLLSITLFAQNELYLNGGTVYINGQVGALKSYSAGDMPTLYVNGEVINSAGTIQNAAGEIQITKDFNNGGTLNSTGDEVFVGTTASTALGAINGTGTTNNFNNLILSKNTSSTYLNLANDANVKSYINIASGIIRTDNTSHGNDGAAYNILYLMSTTPADLVAASSGNVQYVEGKLMRATASGSTYFFPIGAAPSSYDGMEPVSFVVNSGSGNILGYIHPATYSYSNVIFQDIGTDPNSNSLNPYENCTGGPDGILDAFPLSNDFPQEWVFTNPSGTVSNYNITVQPGTLLDATESYTSTCGGTWRYLLKNGIPGGDGNTIAAGPSSVFTGPGTTLAAYNGVNIAPTGNTLSAQSSFSSFRLHGPATGGGALPVTYLYLTAKAVENSYIRLDWATASERDNKGFVIERSEDGRTWQNTGWKDGNGTTTTVMSYSYNDQQVAPNVVYYYRLRQTDYSGREELSNIVAAKILGEDKFEISEFIPTRIENASIVNITTTVDRTIDIKIINMLGQIVYTDIQNINAGNSSIAFDFSNIAAGTYSASFISNGEIIGKKFVIVR